MQLHGNTTKRIAFLGMMLTASLILSYIESILPLNFSVPGIKLGLANLCVVILIYTYGVREAAIVNAMRIVLAGFMFGNLSMIMYSLAGAVLSICFMILFKRLNIFSVCGVSLIGGVAHNLGQLIVAGLVVENFKIVVYAPVLLIAGTITGFVLGVIANTLLPILRRNGM